MARLSPCHRLLLCGFGLLGWAAPAAAADSTAPLPATPAPSYTFEGHIEQATLENNLARSIQYMGLCAETPAGADHLQDNLRLVRELRPKFIGRAALAWDVPADDNAHYELARTNAAKVHAIDPEIILQACVFETAYSAESPETAERVKQGFPACGVERVAVPEWVFAAFGQPPVARTFNYEAMLYRDGHYRNLWLPGASVPDISQLETRMWLYYRACRYIDAGYESIHMGQVMLMDDCDPDHAQWIKLLEMVRAHGKQHARRHYVLLDAHLSDPQIIVKNGRLLWDFVGYPLRVTEGAGPLEGQLQLGRLDAIYNKVPGGLHPSGWSCDVIPQLYEVDNCSSVINDDNEFWIWGADESTWFANLRPEKRDAFLRQAGQWIWNNVPHGYLEVPGRRPANVPINKPATNFYIANNASPACPTGFGQEAAIASLWNDPRNAQTMTRPDARPTATQNTPAPASAAPAPADGLVGHWTFADVVPQTDAPATLRNGAATALEARLARGYLADELKALYLVEGDRNAPQDAAQGQRQLTALRAAMQPLTVPSPHGPALRLAGGPYVELPGHPWLSGRSLTIALWVKAEKLDQPFTLLEQANWMRKDYQLAWSQADHQLYAEVRDANDAIQRLNLGPLRPGAWTHVVLALGPDGLSGALDGKALATLPSTRPAPTSQFDPLLLGRNLRGVQVADLRIYTRPLSAAELQTLAAATPAKK